jgi:MEKHLA domain
MSSRFHTGADLLGTTDSQASDSVLKQLWHHSDAVICCSLKASPHLTHPKTQEDLVPFGVRVSLELQKPS